MFNQLQPKGWFYQLQVKISIRYSQKVLPVTAKKFTPKRFYQWKPKGSTSYSQKVLSITAKRPISNSQKVLRITSKKIYQLQQKNFKVWVPGRDPGLMVIASFDANRFGCRMGEVSLESRTHLHLVEVFRHLGGLKRRKSLQVSPIAV